MPPKVLSSGALQMPELDQTYVYRAYCRCGDLLYIGMTNELIRRFAGHLRRAPWYDRVARIEWDLYPSRRQADRAEKRMIRDQHPRYNVQGAGVRHDWKPLPWPKFLTGRDLDMQAADVFHGKSPIDRLFASDDWGRPA